MALGLRSEMRAVLVRSAARKSAREAKPAASTAWAMSRMLRPLEDRRGFPGRPGILPEEAV